MLKRLLAHRLTRDLGVDDARTTERRRQIIQEKKFLRRIYEEWYGAIADTLPAGDGAVLEIGSGGGFMHEWIPGLITSDVLPVPGVSVVLDGHELPFADRALRAIVMTDVLHHLSRVHRFLTEAARCLRAGGAIIMIEPWNTPWARLIYQKLHPEPFRPESPTWEFPETGPLSGANGALPWILFSRDRRRFEREFPQLRISGIRPFMPFRYLVSGGVSLRKLAPDWSYGLWLRVEAALARWMHLLAMFAHIKLVKVKAPG